MPIYEFRCRECNNIEESMQKVSDPNPSICAACGSQGALEKLVSHTSFQLKGGGWYSDLYASPKKAESAGEGSVAKTETSPAPAIPKKETPPTP